MEAYKPRTRSTQLLVQELPDEVLLYDLERNEVHCLNGPAARVWALCDGQRSVPEIAQLLGSDVDSEAAEALVLSALEQFTEKHLLEEVDAHPPELYSPTGMTRRQMVLRVGLVVGLLPVVDSIVSPPAAMAASHGMTPCGASGGGSTPMCTPTPTTSPAPTPTATPGP